MNRIDLTFDEVSWDDDLRLTYCGEPYTGEAIETVGGAQVISRDFYVDGVLHGPTKQWWADGRIMTEGQMRHGLAVGVFRTWHNNGQLGSEVEFSDTGQEISRREWDEAGKPIQRISRMERYMKSNDPSSSCFQPGSLRA
ncbi:toxin-antitoxin system YwqK family antitoxin [Nocardia pseudobrasiliensis]|uniref:MORN repeat protein n=1 Tax=Nocardia pseudobrasiliensis TaxID=45979 RepID=A0A370IF30_9NOCA|nr:hypothetical protein [Nocardia pseudobrasiliensis]RDI69303.1 hypothetical protein DFR76_101841 [Nocardia pseudobrasiliensis]